MTDDTLADSMQKSRRVKPPVDLAADANVNDEAHDRTEQGRQVLWEQAAERVASGRKWDQVLDWPNPPLAPLGILRESTGVGGPIVHDELRQHDAGRETGASAKPHLTMSVAELPKARAGKIMRRLLKAVAEQRKVGDRTTLADSTVRDLIRSSAPVTNSTK
jgi:hypothetical protein